MVEVQQSSKTFPTPLLLTVANPGTTATFSAQALDQFGLPMTTQPSFTWSVAGGTAGGSINSAGVYSRPSSVTGTPSDLINATATVDGVTVTGIASVEVPATSIAAPTIVDPAGANATPLNLSQLRLTILGADSNGPESGLTYTWETLQGPTGAPSPKFSINGTNAAKETIATCSDTFPLNYRFLVTVRNIYGLSISRELDISDLHNFTTVSISPQQSAVGVGANQTYTAVAEDQYGRAVTPQPAFIWKVDGSLISNVGGGTFIYAAPSTPGEHTIRAEATVGATTRFTEATTRIIVLTPPIMKIISPDWATGSPASMINAETPISIVSDNPDGEQAPWALWLIPAGGSRILLASGSTSVGQAPDQGANVALIKPLFWANGLYVLQLTSSVSNPNSSIVDSKSLQIQTDVKSGVLAGVASAAASPSQINLAWGSTDDSFLSYNIYRGSTANFLADANHLIATLPSYESAYVDDSVPSSGTYFYKVTAVDSGIESLAVDTQANSSNVSSTIVAPNGVSALPQSPTEINIAWSEQSLNVASFKILRSDDGGSWHQVGTANAGDTLFSDNQVEPGQNYQYEIAASNSAATSATSQPTTSTTAPTVTSGPPVLTATVLDSTGTNIQLNWTSDGTATQFKIYWIVLTVGPSSLAYTWQPYGNSINGNIQTLTVAGLTAEKIFSFEVVATTPTGTFVSAPLRIMAGMQTAVVDRNKATALSLLEQEEAKHSGQPYYNPRFHAQGASLRDFFDKESLALDQYEIRIDPTLTKKGFGGQTFPGDGPGAGHISLTPGFKSMDVVHELVHAIDSFENWNNQNTLVGSLQNAEALAHTVESIITRLDGPSGLSTFLSKSYPNAVAAQQAWRTAWKQLNQFTLDPNIWAGFFGGGSVLLTSADLATEEVETKLHVSYSFVISDYDAVLEARGLGIGVLIHGPMFNFVLNPSLR